MNIINIIFGFFGFILLAICFVVFFKKDEKDKIARKMERRSIFSKKKKEKTIDFVNGDNGIENGILHSQLSKRKNNSNPIGWTSTVSYQEDLKSVDVVQFMSSDEDVTKKIDSKNPLVLLVDDSITVLQYVTPILKNLNCDVVTKGNGKEAIDFLREMKRLPDLIISDIEMPIITGVELIRMIREDRGFNNIPILVVSSYPEKYLHLMEDELIQGFMNKPFQKQDFMGQINYLLNNSLDSRIKDII